MFEMVDMVDNGCNNIIFKTALRPTNMCNKPAENFQLWYDTVDNINLKNLRKVFIFTKKISLQLKILSNCVNFTVIKISH